MGVALADVYGRLRIVVKNADDEKPIAKATITLEDSANVHPKTTLTTGADGTVTTGQLESRPWHVSVEADQFQLDKRDVTVANDTTTEVEILLEPLKEKVIKITGQRIVVKSGDTSNTQKRDQNFQQKFPSAGSNPQSLQKLVLTTPGMAQDSNGQAHPRGEHSATTVYINGFQLPGAFQGRGGQVLSPTAIQNIDILTGGYAPEYGSETAAILNVNLRSGTLKPFQSYDVQAGTFSTGFTDLTFGGQIGRPYGLPNDDGLSARELAYLFDFTGRTTANAVEPPQPNIQTAHNRGQSGTFFGNFDFHLSSKDTLGVTLADNPANTQVANRTGLPDSYAQFGQGFGYAGALSRQQALAMGIGSQKADGQDINQTDHNEFGVVSWRRTLSSTTSSFLSVGLVHSGLDTTNNNPLVNLGNLPVDNSIEFNPSIFRNSHDLEVQGSVTSSLKTHTLKIGFLDDQQNGNESYQLIPASQTAEQALIALDPRLAPVNGVSPTLTVSKSGYYRAAYAQDTWKITPKFTLNYGLRLDNYHQSETSLVNGLNATPSNVDQTNLSPRVNAAYALTPKTVVRASFNRLFIQPPIAQGAIVGTQIKPETLSQYDASIEQQVGAGQSVKLGAYKKLITNQIDTSLLIGGTQIGAYTSVNLDRGHVQGVELSYNLTPVKIHGLSAYLSYANSLAKPSGFDNTGAAVPTYNDHDQLHTLSLGANYALKDGTNFGLDFYFGSGVESSKVSDSSPRKAHSFLNFQFEKPNLFRNVGVFFLVENIFDDRSILNFQSGFSGTRFQQGRRAMIGLKGTF
jgi:outer membrane receptor protein involved in Fe transport